MPQKRKAESNESENDSHFPEVVDNATRNDLPYEYAAIEDSEEEEQDAAGNLAQGPKKKPAPDGDNGFSSSSGWGGDSEGVGGNDGAGKRRSCAPDQGLSHSSAKPILRLLTCLGIERHCAICMINIEKFQNENKLVKLDDNRIHYICTVNRRNKKYVDTYVSVIGEYNLQIYTFTMKHLKFTGHSFHPDKISKSFVMTFKEQKKRAETHVRSEVTLPVITNRMLDK